MNLRPYQAEDAALLAQSKTKYLVGDCGIGKTPIAVSALRLADPARVLIVAPAVALNVWKNHLQDWWPESAQRQIKIVSYDVISRGNKQAQALLSLHWDVLILDEAHYLKSFDATRTRAILGYPKNKDGLVHQCKQVWALSATPMPSHAGELYPVLARLAPETIEHSIKGRVWSREEFEARYCVFGYSDFGRTVTGSRNLHELKRRTERFYHRRRKADVLKDLPPVTVSTVELAGTINKSTLDQINQALEAVIPPDMDVSEVVQVLQTEAQHLASVRRLTGIAKARLVVDYAEMLLESGESKIVVFAYHKDVITLLEDWLCDYAPVVIAGDTPQKAREDAVSLFQDPKSRSRIFIGQIQAAGTAITLTAANRVLFAESDWVPANNHQALSRCHRIGQDNPVQVDFLALPGSIDQHIQRALARKSADIDAVFS